MTDDELLSPKPVPTNEGLKAELLGRTAQRLRFVRRTRLASRVAVCVVCFAAGAALGVRLKPDLRSVPEPQVVYVEVPPVANAPGSPPGPPAVARTPSPAELELQAEQAPAKVDSARLFREAGDRYLRDFADYRAALRCYRNFLDEADRDALTASPDDTWLLTSLKRARAQERTQ